MLNDFAELAPRAVCTLKKWINMNDEDAFAIVGNGAHESNGFADFHQIGGTAIGWWQWDGARGEQFREYASRLAIDITSPAASMGFLILELKTTQREALAYMREAGHLYAKVVAFERYFERAGKPEMADRYAWTQKVMRLPASTFSLV